MSTVAHYCQKCLAANPLGQEFCARCGTRLMIIVEPSTARYEAAEAVASNDEHLLERISALENRLSRLSEKLERSLDLLLRQAQNSHFDRALVKSLVAMLSDDGVIQNERLEELWIDRCRKDAEQQQESERREELRAKIVAAYRGDARGDFEQSVTEGFLLIDDGQISRGIGVLRRAADTSADNAPLLTFIAEYFFKLGKTTRARRYLERAHKAIPTDRRVSLLLGLTCADDGDTDRAKELLGDAMKLGGSSFAAHYGLGRVFVAEENWQKALREFKLALAIKASPEAHYALACLYYQLCRDSLAARHLRKALEMDESYGEALHLLDLIRDRAAQKGVAGAYFQKTAPRDLPGVRPRKRNDAVVAPLFKAMSAGSRRLITGGDRRLAEALRQDALNSGNVTENKTR